MNKMPYKAQIEVLPEQKAEEFIDKMAHFKRIRLLEDANNYSGKLEDKIFYVKEVDKKAEAIK